MANSTLQSEPTDSSGSCSSLISVEAIPERFRRVFAAYKLFNTVQSAVFHRAFNTDEWIVVTAPTSSGKTAIFEMAIVRLLNKFSDSDFSHKMIYIAPLKAICEERFADWHKKFAPFNIKCILATGDSDNTIDMQLLMDYHLIISTPEKWDALTRKWKDDRRLVQLIRLFMIDEVHLLKDESRGPTMEAIVSRMKTIQVSFGHQSPTATVRFLAIAATIPNTNDVAEWLGGPNAANAYHFDDRVRPVKLQKIVLGYPFNAATSSPYKFDIGLNYRLQSVIMQYSNGKPVLIFCNMRNSVEMAAKFLCQNLTIAFTPDQCRTLQQDTAAMQDQTLREMVRNGVGYHHSGVSATDRRIVEEVFRRGWLPVLIATSSLAMGVNLPARLVIVKSTKYYTARGWQEYDEGMLQQMIGRAGRPQYDTEGVAVILTTSNEKAKYENMLNWTEPLESTLHQHLTEHINAEIVLGTITDLGVAMQWLHTTFLQIRARKNPKHYNLPLDLTPEQIDRKLLELCQISINKLTHAEMILINPEDVTITPTPSGCLMARFCLAFETMQLFNSIAGYESLQQLLGLISKCREFSDIYLRVHDKKYLNLLNNCRKRATIRFPFNGKFKSVDMKINCLIQAVFGCLDIAECSLMSEAQKIMKIGERITKCLVEYLSRKNKCFSALLNAIILAKCFSVHLWENSPFLSKQFQGIGNVLSMHLAKEGLVTFKDILSANPRSIEMILNKKCGLGNSLQDQIRHLPIYELEFGTEKLDASTNLRLTVHVRNAERLRTDSTVDLDSSMSLIVGNKSNDVIVYTRYSHNRLINNEETVKHTIPVPSNCEQTYHAYLISEDWVGIDAKAIFTVNTKREQELPRHKNKMLNEIVGKPRGNLIQTSINNYTVTNPKNPNFQPIPKPKESKNEQLHRLEEQVNGALSNFYRQTKHQQATNFNSNGFASISTKAMNNLHFDDNNNASTSAIFHAENVHKHKIERKVAYNAADFAQNCPRFDSKMADSGYEGSFFDAEPKVRSMEGAKKLKSLTWMSPLVTFSNATSSRVSTNRCHSNSIGATPFVKDGRPVSATQTKRKHAEWESSQRTETQNDLRQFHYVQHDKLQHGNVEKVEKASKSRKIYEQTPMKAANFCENSKEYSVDQKSANNIIGTSWNQYEKTQ